MRTTIILAYLTGFLTIYLVSCEKDNQTQIEFKLQVLDESGIERQNYTLGENIIFSFLIINKTDNSIYFYHAKSIKTEEFFNLYKIEGEEEINLGRPYETIFCEFINGYTIRVNDSLNIQVPWIFNENIQSWACIHNNTDTLPIGDYRTGFSSQFKFEGFTTKNKRFSTQFSIHND
jgi:hypothetical protein